MQIAPLLETDRQRGDDAKIWRVTSDAELSSDAEHSAVPQERIEPHVNAAQQSVRVRQDDVCGVSAGEVSNVEPCGNRRGWADRQAGTHPAANDICGVEL